MGPVTVISLTPLYNLHRISLWSKASLTNFAVVLLKLFASWVPQEVQRCPVLHPFLELKNIKMDIERP